MKKSTLITILIVIIGSLGLYKMLSITKSGYYQHKGLVKSLIRINEEELAENTRLIHSINGEGTKISVLMIDPQTKVLAQLNNITFHQIKHVSNHYDDFYLNKINELIEAEKGKYPWFKKDENSQVTTYNNFYSLKNILSYDVSTRVYGSDSEKSDSLGKQLTNELIKYRNELIEIIVNSTIDYNYKYLELDTNKLENHKIFKNYLHDNHNSHSEELINIYSLLTRSKMVYSEGEAIDWRLSRFYKKPLISVIYTFTSLRNDIRKAEKIAAELLFNRIYCPMTWTQDEKKIKKNFFKK